MAMRGAATQRAGYHQMKLQGLARELARSGQWTSLPALLVLTARFRWLSLRTRVRARVWQMVNRRAAPNAGNRGEPPVPYRDQSTSTLDVAE